MLSDIFKIAAALIIYRVVVKSFTSKENPYRRPNTKFEQMQIDRQMKEFLESNPDHSFFADNPIYKEKYLKQIDLSEIGFDK